MRREARVGITIAAVAASGGIAVWAITRPPPPPAHLAHDTKTPAVGCSPGKIANARAAGIWARLARAPEGARLVGRLGEPRPVICFVAGESGLMQQTLLLDERLDDDAAAARAGHLLSHLLEHDSLDPETATDCDAFGRAALEAEERAHRIEATLLEQLGHPDARRAPNAAARAVVEAYLERCRRARGAR